MIALLILLAISIINIIIDSQGESLPITGWIGLAASILLAAVNFKSIIIASKLFINKLFNRFSNFIEFHILYEELESSPPLSLVRDALFDNFDIHRISIDEPERVMFDLRTDYFSYNMTFKKANDSIVLLIEDLKVNNKEYDNFEDDVRNLVHYLSRVIPGQNPTFFIKSKYTDLNPTFSAMFNHVKIDEIKHGSFCFTVSKKRQKLDITLTKDSVFASIENFIELKHFLSIANGVNSYIFTILRHFT